MLELHGCSPLEGFGLGFEGRTEAHFDDLRPANDSIYTDGPVRVLKAGGKWVAPTPELRAWEREKLRRANQTHEPAKPRRRGLGIAYIDRPGGRPSRYESKRARIRELRASGATWMEIARETGVPMQAARRLGMKKA